MYLFAYYLFFSMNLWGVNLEFEEGKLGLGSTTSCSSSLGI